MQYPAIETKSVFMFMLVEPWLESLMIKFQGGCSINAFYLSWNFGIFGSLLFEWQSFSLRFDSIGDLFF